MEYKNTHINQSVEVIVDLTRTAKTMYEILGMIDQIRATSRYKEIYLHSESSSILGVLA